MPNKSYAKGYRLERAVVKHMEALGYEAERRFMSKGGIGEDVECWVAGYEDGVHYYIQCKADGRKKNGKPASQGMMKPSEWNRFRNSVSKDDLCLLANGTPSHIKFWEITGLRDENLRGGAATKDIEKNMRPFEPIDVHWLSERE